MIYYIPESISIYNFNRKFYCHFFDVLYCIFGSEFLNQGFFLILLLLISKDNPFFFLLYHESYYRNY
jgi:hypothetical protein